jgi:hypothetical protein
LSGIIVQIGPSRQEVFAQTTSPAGLTRFEKLMPGSYQLTLPLVDDAAWELIETKALEHPESSGDAVWGPPEVDSQPDSHIVELGDCMSNIAFRTGFLPQSLWDFNAALQDGVKRLNILNPKDVVKLPSRRLRVESATTGNHYKLRRKGVPERLRIRFTNYRLEPREGVRYLLHIETAFSGPVSDRSGKLDGDGFLTEPIPPDAVRGEILLDDDFGTREIVEVHLGYVNPLSEVSGVQARLNNLHYPAGTETGELNEQTIEALCQFQYEQELPVTGQIDGATKARLLQLHLS